jgi:hypothetical protein
MELSVNGGPKMPCYSPMIGWRKKDGSVYIYGDLRNENWKTAPESLLSKGVNPYTDERIIIPCGKCTGCRLEYSKQWADRCYLEAKMWKANYWLTLTYDEEHIQHLLVPAVDKKTGEVIKVASLYKKDLQDFMKRIRERWKRIHNNPNVRFYACGEYGEQNHRPHFHVILFNFVIPDLELIANKNGFAVFQSEEVSKVWGMGNVTINRNSWLTAAYTARYMMKKRKGKWAKQEYAEAGINPEFCLCSRKPGIGYGYYEAHKDEIYSKDGIAYAKAKGGAQTRKPPKYFDKLFKLENPKKFEEIQELRKNVAEHQFKYRLVGKTTLPRIEYYKLEEQVKQDTIKALRRTL